MQTGFMYSVRHGTTMRGCTNAAKHLSSDRWSCITRGRVNGIHAPSHVRTYSLRCFGAQALTAVPPKQAAALGGACPGARLPPDAGGAARVGSVFALQLPASAAPCLFILMLEGLPAELPGQAAARGCGGPGTAVSDLTLDCACRLSPHGGCHVQVRHRRCGQPLRWPACGLPCGVRSRRDLLLPIPCREIPEWLCTESQDISEGFSEV